MTIEQILEKIRAALEEKSGWEACTAYHAVPFSTHEKQLLVLELTGQTWGGVFDAAQGLARRLVLHLRIAMLLPSETDVAAAHTDFYERVFPALTALGCTVQQLKTGTPEQLRLYRRMLLYADFDLCCVYRESMEVTESNAQ